MSIRGTVAIPNVSSGEFPEVFECNICKEMLLEKEREDHMLCHELEKSSINDSNANNDLYASRRTIEQQKEIEREIERRNRERMQNEDNRNNNINNNDSIRRRTNININIGNNSIVDSIPINQNRNNNYNEGLNNNSRGLRISRLVSFNDFNNISINPELIRSYFSNLSNSYNDADANDNEVMDELVETEIENVNKLALDKKKCVICLEDFKNGDKAIFLPCIHLFHKDCIMSWLDSHNNCPICKFKLSGENSG